MNVILLTIGTRSMLKRNIKYLKLVFTALSFSLVSASVLGASPKLSMNENASVFHEAMAVYYHQIYKGDSQLADWRKKSWQVISNNRRIENGGCENTNWKDYVTVFLKADSKGIVTDVFTSSETKKAKCMKKAFKGIELPPPSLSPAYLSITALE